MSEVVPGVFVGDQQDAFGWGGHAICVLETPPQVILTRVPPGFNVGLGSALPGELQVAIKTSDDRVSIEALNLVANLIDAFKTSKAPVLVRCAGGIERSPLAVAWWVYSRDSSLTWSQAYDVVKKARPQTQDRTHWLPSEVIKELR